MNGRVHPIFLVLLLVLAAAVWFLFLRDDAGGRTDGVQGESHDGSDPGPAVGDPLGAVVAEMLHLPYQESFRGHLQIKLDPSLAPGGKIDIADIYEVEILFDHMDPPLTDLASTGLLQGGWNERGVKGGYRFFTISNPVPRDGTFAKWQFQFDTSEAPGPGPKLSGGRIRLYDREGALIGVKAVVLK